jgi:hypothetical protein
MGDMLLKCELVYKKGSNPVNEDALVINEDKKIFAVIDGATGLEGLSGKIAAEIVRNSLEKMSVNESLKDVIKMANLRLSAETA